MGLTFEDRQFTEIFIQGYKNPLFTKSMIENQGVSWIFFPIPGPDVVVPECLERRNRASPDARVKKDAGTHDASAVGKRSSLSWRARSAA